jgi:hypothetical protein
MPKQIKLNSIPCPKCGSATGVSSGRPLVGNIYKRERSCKTCGCCFPTYEICEEDALKLYGDGLVKHHNANSICWDCRRATGFCSWSREFEPVQGWVAEPTEIKSDKAGTGTVSSYEVRKCPLFEMDERR